MKIWIRFLRLSNALPSVIGFRCTFLAWYCVACSAQEPSIVQRQQATLRLLADYETSSDWHKRMLIKSATGESEILASRIFRAFEILSRGHAPMDDVSVVQAARDEIYRNATLSLAILHPIVFEKATPEDKTTFANLTYPPVSDENQSLYLQICGDIAAVETNGTAQSILTEFSNSTNAQLAALARLQVKQVSRENWQTMRKSYERTRSPRSLRWLVQHALRKGMTRPEVETYVGGGIENSSFGFDYSAADGDAKSTLELKYWDGILYRWEWKN
jgi:hypothetical protein